MNTNSLHRIRYAALLSGLGLCLAINLCAQQPQRPGYSGGANRGGPAMNNAGGTQPYNVNGAVGNATISVDPDSHNITIMADEETTKYIAQVITNLDRPQPQVLIKVVFVEVTHDDSSDIGVEGGWMKGIGGSRTGSVANVFGLSALASPGGSNAPTANPLGQPLQSFQSIAPFASPGAGLYQVLGSDFQATLRAIAQAGKADVLSRPSILARNNQPASIGVGQFVPLITGVSYNSLTGSPISSVQWTQVGIILTVTPYITSDGLVQMIVAPQTSSIDPTTSIQIAQGINAPVIDERSANTVVVTPDGQTVVIGGLMQRSKMSSDTKIPFLGDIPWLGNLFKRKVQSSIKTELLIFLTPYVVQAPSQLAGLSEKERKQALVPKSYSEEQLDLLLDRIPAHPPKDGNASPSKNH